MVSAYARPASTADAVAALRATPGARMVAGGTDLMVQLRLGQRHSELAVDTAGLDELHETATNPAPVIGAAVKLRTFLGHRELASRYPALAQAASLLGGRQIQAMATIGGNICNASPAAETATPLLVYEAQAEIAGPDARRTVPLTDFFQGPGETVLKRDELLVAVRLSPDDGTRRSAYRRLELRRSVDIAVVSAAARLDVEDGHVAAARLAIGAVNPTPVRVPDAEAALVGIPIGDRSILPGPTRRAIKEAAAVCRQASNPIDDTRAAARYRRAMVEAIASRAVLDAIAQPGQGQSKPCEL